MQIHKGSAGFWFYSKARVAAVLAACPAGSRQRARWQRVVDMYFVRGVSASWVARCLHTTESKVYGIVRTLNNIAAGRQGNGKPRSARKRGRPPKQMVDNVLTLKKNIS